MVYVIRLFEMAVATAFYSGLCYMIFDGAGAAALRSVPSHGACRARQVACMMPGRCQSRKSMPSAVPSL
jgi:hypothetical protein